MQYRSAKRATGGAQALAKLLQFPFDNVVIDRFLPDLDATEVAEQIRQLFPQIEVELMDSRRAQESGESRSAQSALGKREASVESEEGAHTAEAIAAGGVAVAGAPRFETGNDNRRSFR
jgi:CheY-like chemotaxis protein